VVERELGQLVDRMPVGVVGERGVDVARHEPEIGGRELAARRAPVGVAERFELLDVREFADVDLCRQVPADRLLERLVGGELPARE